VPTWIRLSLEYNSHKTGLGHVSKERYWDGGLCRKTGRTCIESAVESRMGRKGSLKATLNETIALIMLLPQLLSCTRWEFNLKEQLRNWRTWFGS